MLFMYSLDLKSLTFFLFLFFVIFVSSETVKAQPTCNGLTATIVGTEGDDILDGTNGADVIVGFGGNDTINGSNGADTICGGDGADIILGSNGNDFIDGEAGNDEIDGGNNNDTLIGGDGEDLIIGFNGNDTITGGIGDDELDGGNGTDSISGGDGDDTLIGFNGNDELNGGSGFDTLDAGNGNDTCIDGEDNTSCEIELGGDPTANQFCNGLPATIVGTEGDDILNGTNGNDVIVGLGGNDTIDGGNGFDTICGGDGDDIITGSNGDDFIDGGGGNDDIDGGNGGDNLIGGDGNDSIIGFNGNDTLDGGAGDDNLDGGNNSDVISGGDGNDTLIGFNGNDNLNGDAGDDILNGGNGADELNGGSGFDVIDADNGNDTCIDGESNTNCETEIGGENNTPTAIAGVDQTVLVGDTVQLDGSASSDLDGDLLSFFWNFLSKPQNSNAILSDSTSPQPSFTVDVLGDYIFELIVNDGIVDSDPDTVTISTQNSQPVANAGADQTVFTGDNVKLDGTGSSDPDGDQLTFLWNFTSKPETSNTTLSDSTSSQPSFKVDVFGEYILELIVNDGVVDGTPDEVVITTENSPPVADAGADQTVFTGDNVQLDGTGSSDVDGDPLSFLWSFTSRPDGSNASLLDNSVPQPSFTADTFGQYILQLIVNDGTEPSNPDTVTVNTENSPPVANAGEDQSISVLANVQLNGSGSSDVDGNQITFNWSIISRPDGSSAELSDSNVVNPAFNADVLGIYTVQLIVNDGIVNSSPDTVVITTINTRPVADAGLDQTVLVNDTVILDGNSSSDADNDALSFTWSLMSVPDGSSAVLQNPDTESPSFVADVPGDYVVQLIVNDGTVNSIPDTVVITTGNSKPLADAGVDQTVSPNSTVELDGAGSFDVDLDSLAFSWSLISVPNGSASVLNDPTLTNPTFIVDRPGTYVAQLIVNDGTVNSDPDTVVITRENKAPVLDSVGNQTVSVGNTLTLNLIGSDPDSDELSFSAIPLPLPQGASINSSTGVFTFSPNSGQVGDIAITFTLSDSELTDSESITITVDPGVQGNTTLSGRVTDANDASNNIDSPVVGATVSIIGTGITTTTDSNGSFTLSNLPGGSQVFDIDASTSNTTPDGSTYASFREAIDLIPDVVNNVNRSFFLPRISAGSLTTVDPNNTTIVDNTDINVVLEIPPNSAELEDGTLFTEEISISEVPPDFAPAPLPEELEPGLLVTIQPVGVIFTTPAPITFPNIDNLASGSEVDIWSLDPDTGEFTVVGIGMVSPDGSVIETISGGIMQADWHFPMPPGPGGGPPGDDPPPCDDCCGGPTGSTTAFATGNLNEEHSLVSYRSLNTDKTLTFEYNSTFADPQPIIEVESVIPVRGAVPPNVSLSVEIGGVDQGVEIFTDTSGFNENMDEPFVHSIQLDASSLVTGVYDYEIRSKSNYPQSSVSLMRNGELLVNNLSESHFGAGWSIGNIQRLYIQSNGNVLIDEGDGDIWFFEQGSNIVFIDDNFNNENGGLAALNYFGFENWLVFDGTVDIIGNGTFDLLPGNGLYVDLDGSNFNAGRLESIQELVLEPGEYVLEFDIAGSQRNANIEDTVNVSLGTLYSEQFTFPSAQPFTRITRNISVGSTTTAKLVFDHEGGDAEGLLLDDVIFSGTSGLSNSFVSPPRDFSTLERNLDNTFTRTMKDGTQISFDQDGLQTSVVDTNGNTTTYEYDAQDRLTTITDPFGLVTILAYTGNNISTVTDPVGRTTTFTHGGNGNLVRITDPDGSFREFSYDSNHRLISQTSKRGFVTTYQYDQYGRNTGALRADGSVRSVSSQWASSLPDMSGGVGTESNPAPVVRPEDVFATFTDGNGNTTSYELNEFGGIEETTDALGRTTVSTRDGDNNITQSIDPRGNITDMTYDEFGNLLTSTNQAIGATTTFTYTDDGFNNISTITDPNGNTVTNNYDSNGNLTSVVDALGNTNTNAYNAFGQITSTTDALNNVVSFSYDANSNLSGTTDQLGNSTNLILDSAGNVISSEDRLGRITTFEYDSLNRLTKVIDPDLAETIYTYDMEGNLTSVMDANENTTSFAYDSLNRVISKTDPLGNSDSVNYDPQGNLLSTTDRKGQTIDYNWDSANRLTSKLVPGNGTTAYVYDGSNNLTQITDPDSNLTMTYDGANRLSSVSTNGSPTQPSVDINYTYDPAGNLLSMTDSVSGTTSYVYDGSDRLTSLTDPSSQIIGFNYDQLNRLTQRTFPNGTSTDYQYNGRSDLLTLSNMNGANIISEFNYAYDEAGKRKSLDTIRSSETVSSPLNYDYDNLDRLLMATNPLPSGSIENFSYDPVGNRLTEAGQIIQSIFDDANRLIEDNNFTYVYNLNGNLIEKTDKNTSDITQYIYDFENRLIQITSPSVSANYKYDGLGRRIEKDINGDVSRYIYENTEVGANFILEYDGSNQLVSRYNYGLGIDDPLIIETSGSVNFYCTDGLGSITEITDSAGNIINSYVYDSFGTIVSQNETINNPFTYTARESEFDSLYYYRARYYDSSIGRFLNEDPLGIQVGLNFYIYVENNPLNFTDPTGLLPSPCSVKCTTIFTFVCFGAGVVATPPTGIGCGLTAIFICDEACDDPEDRPECVLDGGCSPDPICE